MHKLQLIYPPRDQQKSRKVLARVLEKYLTQERREIKWLANETGLHRTSISRLLKGKMTAHISTCYKLARAMGLDENKLLKLAGYLVEDFEDNEDDTIA
jgi:transcriptional regulator with XRE-family HTH domain